MAVLSSTNLVLMNSLQAPKPSRYSLIRSVLSNSLYIAAGSMAYKIIIMYTVNIVHCMSQGDESIEN